MIEQPKKAQSANGIIDVSRRVFTLLIKAVETRLRLVVLELEEEKVHVIQLIILVGLTLLFAAFSLMSLFVLVLLVVNPADRLTVLVVMTIILLVLTLIGAVWTLRKARRSTMLVATLQQLKIDNTVQENNSEHIGTP